MIDRENIINGLREMSCRATWEDIDRIRHKIQPIINGAIELLKEQEAVEPKVIRTNSFGDPVHACGKCGILITESMNYCCECGKRIKWED